MDGGPSLRYQWFTVGTPPGNVSYGDPNIENAALQQDVTFSAAGTYTFKVKVINDDNVYTISDPVTVIVSQTATSASISPATGSVAVSTGAVTSADTITVILKDQFS